MTTFGDALAEQWFGRRFDFDTPPKTKNPNLYVRLAASTEEGYVLAEDSTVLRTEDNNFISYES